MRAISSTSRKPRVVMRPTRAARPSTIALVTMVVPCASAAARPAAGSSARSPLTTPVEGCAGVVGTLHEYSRPDGSRATTSVNVPPTSTPTVVLASVCRGTGEVYRSRDHGAEAHASAPSALPLVDLLQLIRRPLHGVGR